jgi:hypothetical protein
MRRLKGICVALTALATFGCGAATAERPAPAALVSAKTATAPATSRASASAEIARAANSPDASAELAKAWRALAGVKSFRALMTTTGGGGVQDRVETRTEASLPDRFHVFNAEYELIIIGAEVYRRLPGGKWQTSPTGLAVTSLTDPKKLEEYLSSARVAFVGSETLDGSTARVYLAAAPRSPARKSVHDDPDPFMMKIWVGSSDGLPRKLEGTVLSTKTKTAVSYYDFNAKIAVKKPTGRT